jgi:excisionase family DNA binding protein
MPALDEWRTIVINVEIRFLVSGREVSLDSFAAALVADIRQAMREEISQLSNPPVGKDLGPTLNHDHKTPPLAVSKREAARMLGVSERTVDNYIALKAIRCVRVGKRVLIPMRSLHEVVSKGI